MLRASLAVVARSPSIAINNVKLSYRRHDAATHSLAVRYTVYIDRALLNHITHVIHCKYCATRVISGTLFHGIIDYQ